MISLDGKEYKVIISDFDGTLAGSDKTVPEPVKGAIKKLKEHEVTFLLASGRNFHGIISDACQELGLTAPQITAGGGEIVDPVTREVLSAEYIPNDDAAAIAKLLTDKGIGFWIEKDFEIYTIGKKEDQSLGPSTYREFNEIVFDRIPKIGIFRVSDPEIGDEFVKELGERFTNLHMVKSFSPVGMALDITAAMGNKQEAVLKISRILDVPTEQIIAIGDGYNDFPLFEACGYGVAVANAKDELKEIADKIIPSYEDNGVAVFLNSLFKSNNY